MFLDQWLSKKCHHSYSCLVTRTLNYKKTELFIASFQEFVLGVKWPIIYCLCFPQVKVLSPPKPEPTVEDKAFVAAFDKLMVDDVQNRREENPKVILSLDFLLSYLFQFK